MTLVSTEETGRLVRNQTYILKQILNAFLSLVVVTFQSFETVEWASILTELSASSRGTSVKNKKVLPVYEFFLFHFPIFNIEGF